MNPSTTANAGIAIAEQHGPLGVVIWCSSIIIAGLVVAIIVLWRSLDQSRRETTDARRELSQWLFNEATRQHQFGRELSVQAAMVQSARELMQQKGGDYASSK
jgi:hypothetical protein